MKILRISSGGQVSLPAEVRRRWGTEQLLVDDLGDHVVIWPMPDDPVAAVRGILGPSPRPLEEIREEERREEARLEEERLRRYQG